MSYSVRKLENGKWKGFVELPRSENGKRNRKKTKQFLTKAEATKAAQELENLYLYGSTDPGYENLLFGDLCDKFLASSDLLSKAISTQENYAKVIRNHLKPNFGCYRVKAINYNLVQDFVNELADKGFTYHTIDNIKTVFSVIMFFGMNRLECIQKNPVTKVVIPQYSKENSGRSTQQKNVYIKPEDIQKLFDRFPEGNPSFLPLLLGYKCGCRDGEAYALTWDDVDFENGELDINKQLQFEAITERGVVIGEEWHLKPPKYNSCRRVQLDQETIEILKREKAKQDKAKTEDENYITIYEVGPHRIINYDEGTPVDFIIKKEHGDFKSTNTRAHIGWVAHHELHISYTYHSLRHTHATLLAEEGYSPFDIMQRLGHKNINVTLKYYMHYTENMGKSAQQQLEEIMQKTATKRLR